MGILASLMELFVNRKLWAKLGLCMYCNKQTIFTYFVVSEGIVVTVVSFQLSDLIIETAETARQEYFLHLFLTHEVPTLFIGPTGTGKSAITNNYLLKLPKDQWACNLHSFILALMCCIGTPLLPPPWMSTKSGLNKSWGISWGVCSHENSMTSFQEKWL